MILELTLKKENGELLGKISAFSLESLEEQLHKIEKLMKKNENFITCPCDDQSCPRKGEENLETGHIENCTCPDCHNYYSKISK